MKKIISLILAGALFFQPIIVLAADSQDAGILNFISFEQLKQEVQDRNLTIKSTAIRVNEGQNQISSGIIGLRQLQAPLDASCTRILGYFTGKSTGVKAISATKSDLVTALTGVPIDQNKLPETGHMLVSQDGITKYALTIAKDNNGGFLWMPTTVPFPNPNPLGLSSSLTVTPGSPDYVDTSLIKDQMSLTLDYLNYNLLNIYQSQLMSIESQIQSLTSKSADNGVANIQQSIVNDQIVWGAQQLYLTYNDLSAQAENLQKQLKLLQDQLTIAKLQFQLGMTIGTDVKTTESKISDLAFGLKTLNDNRNWIKGNINIMLDQEFDTNLTIAPNPAVDETTVNALNYDTDLDKAITLSKDILLKVKTESNIIPDSVTYDIQNLKLKTKLDFDKSYQGLRNMLQTLKNEEAKLAIEQEKLDYAQQSYSYGLISTISLEAAKVPYEGQKLKVSNAQTDLVKAYNLYQWLIQGTNHTSSLGSTAGI